MRVNFKQLRVNLHPVLFERLQKELKIGTSEETTVTIIVREALNLYFNYKEKSLISSGLLIGIEEKGLIIPEPKQEEVKPSGIFLKELSTEDHIPTPGPNASQRLKDIGIDPSDVIRARRAKRAGREYDKSLEKYFGSI